MPDPVKSPAMQTKILLRELAMKTNFHRIIVLFVTVATFFGVTAVQAQLPTGGLETLIVDFWPDYDQPNVLVLLSGTLPADTTLPATLTLPLPENAEINALARITEDNRMVADIQYDVNNGAITFTTPTPRFRLEYYVPYETTGTTHAYDFNWQATLPVQEVLAAVQKPAGATTMSLDPIAANVVADSGDGFTYYALPSASIPAGEKYAIHFEYDMPVQQLSVDNLPAPPAPSNANPDASVPDAPAPAADSSSFSLETVNWALVLVVVGLLLIVIAATWMIATRSSSPKPVRKNRKPQPKRTASKASPAAGKAGFCRECGQPLITSDKFCRHCGTAVKK
jgi:hypothetical protein